MTRGATRHFAACVAFSALALSGTGCGSGGTNPGIGASRSTTSSSASTTSSSGVAGHARGRARLTFRSVIQTLPPAGDPPTTPPDQVTPAAQVVLAQADSSGTTVERYLLGPVLLDGTIVASSHAVLGATGQWQVNFTMTASGSQAFNRLARQEYQHQVAIILDDTVISAPTIEATDFQGSGQVTGTFTRNQAEQLAQVLNTPS